MDGVPLYVPATPDNFDERGYLEANPDIAAAVRNGSLTGGRQHFDIFGAKEGRQQVQSDRVRALQAEKIARVTPLLTLDRPHVRRGVKYDFLSDDLRRETGIVHTDAVGKNNYDGYVTALIDEMATGIVLDCGAGSRNTYYSNVVNYDIVDYISTDIVGVGEALPFADDSFDGVISVAVLEHVRDPFRCAAEIVRVLKPGGKLVCCAPFLVPVHGYPHHYYNMTPQGLRALFDRQLEVEDQKVIESVLPVWALALMVRMWADGLQGRVREEFLSMPLRTLVGDPEGLLKKPWVTSLPVEKNFELAAGSMIFARKPLA